MSEPLLAGLPEPPDDPEFEADLSYRGWSWEDDKWVRVYRCEGVHREGKRSWRCTRDRGHEGMHLSGAGGRRWVS